MGQKIHPTGFRVGYIQDWKSNWFDEKGFADVLAEAVELTRERRPFAFATVVWRRAPTSGHIGSKGIVLPDGTQVGSIEPNADAAVPSATQAPTLDVTTGTAQDGGTVLVATPVSGVTGSGFDQ